MSRVGFAVQPLSSCWSPVHGHFQARHLSAISLIIAILFFSKREDSKTIAKLAAPMGVFNINEPIIFGMPIVLNPLYFFHEMNKIEMACFETIANVGSARSYFIEAIDLAGAGKIEEAEARVAEGVSSSSWWVTPSTAR